LKDNNGNTVEIQKLPATSAVRKNWKKGKMNFIGIASHESYPDNWLSIYAQTLAKKIEKKGIKNRLNNLRK